MCAHKRTLLAGRKGVNVLREFNAAASGHATPQPDGRVVLQDAYGILRLEADGSLDRTFNLKAYLFTGGPFYGIDELLKPAVR